MSAILPPRCSLPGSTTVERPLPSCPPPITRIRHRRRTPVLAVVDRDLAVIDLCAVVGRDDGGARVNHRRSTVPDTQLSTLFERNAEFVRSGAGARKHVPELPFLPWQHAYVLTCIDPRTDPSAFFGVALGDAIVARTVGGRVTPAVVRDLAYICYLVETKAPAGPYFEVAVVREVADAVDGPDADLGEERPEVSPVSGSVPANALVDDEWVPCND
jgi:hypothetical protein